MTNLHKFLNFLSEPDYPIKMRAAGHTNTCVICKKKVKGFSTELSKFEYRVSRLCGRCQKTYIHEANENFTTENSLSA